MVLDATHRAFVRDDGRALVSLYRVAKHATDIERTDRHLMSMDTMLLEMTTLRGTINLPASLDTSHMNVLFKIRRVFKRVKPAEPHVQAAFGAHLMALSARRRLSVDTSGGGNDDNTSIARRKSRATANGRSHGGHHRGGTGKPQQRNGHTSTASGNNNGDDSDTDIDEHAAWSTGACCVRVSRRAFRLCCPRLSAADTSLLYPRTRKAIILANAKRAPQASDVAAALATAASSSSASTSTDMSNMPNLLRGLTLSPTNAASSPLSPSSLRSPHLPTKVDPLITSLHKLETQVHVPSACLHACMV